MAESRNVALAQFLIPGQVMKIISLCLVGLLITLAACSTQSTIEPDAGEPYAPCTAAPDRQGVCPAVAPAPLDAYVCPADVALGDECSSWGSGSDLTWCCPVPN